MTKKIAILTGISASAIFFAQDVSTIRNTTEIYDNNIITGTARYSAMAGSMGALGGDISSLNSNPAGLGVFITSDANISLLINSTKTTSSLAGRTTENSIDKTTLGQVGGVLSFQTENNSPWKFINIGINLINEKIDNRIQSPSNHAIILHRTTDDKMIYSGHRFGNSNSTPNNLLYSGHQFERIGSRSKLNLGLGATYENKIYIGAGINISSLNVEQYDELYLTLQNSSPESSAYFKKQNTPFKEDATGFSISAGVIGKINHQIRLGASLESPTWYSIDRDYNYYVNNITSKSSAIYSYTGSENRNVRTPGKLTLSGAFIPNKNFAFNVDYRVDLGKPHFSNNGEAETQLNNFYKSTYKAQNELRFGAEYRVKGFRARGGYAFTTSPFRNYSYTENNFSIIDANGNQSSHGKISNYIVGKSQVLSGGVGYDFKSFYIDATYQHVTYTYTNPFLDGLYTLSTSTNAYYTYSNTSVISNAKTKRGNIMLTLGWKF